MIFSTKNVNVFIFTSVHPWNDVRIFHKQAVSLSQKYIIELHAPAEFKKKHIGNISIIGLQKWHKKSDRIKTFFILFKRVWGSKAEIFHFHDPELVLLGLYIKCIKRKKVIFDVHENTSQLILERTWIPTVFRKPLYYSFRILEKLSMRYFDSIVLAEDSYTKNFPQKNIVIHNYPFLTQKTLEFKKTIDVIYVGGIMQERGIFEILKIVKMVKQTLPLVFFKIIGPIAKNIESDIVRIIETEKLGENIIFTGRMNYDEAMMEIQRAKIGLALLHPIKNYIESLPTKIFEYMNYEVPFLASNFNYWGTIFDNEKIGYLIPYNGTEQWSEKIIDLLQDDKKRISMGKQGRALIEKQYSWTSEEKHLLTLYHSLLSP